MNEVSTAETPVQRISLERIEQSGKILDLGGGSEALVSRLEGKRVYAVDVNLQKIREAQIHPTSSQWILADARNLCFRESSFDVATFWFSLGYFGSITSKKTALQETYRSLRNGGHLSIIAAAISCSEERLVFRTQLTFPDGTVSQIAYGVKGNQNQDVDAITRLVESAGFRVTSSIDHRYWFEIDAVKS